jgi:hypothetical protein
VTQPKEHIVAKKKDDEKVLGPGAFGDVENPDEGVTSGIISDEVLADTEHPIEHKEN